jgi:hypothetical protein
LVSVTRRGKPRQGVVVKPETAPQQQAALSPETPASASEPQGKIVKESLSDEQRRVLDCIRKSGGGLTARQIRSRVGCDVLTLDSVLVSLLERRYISRLNTLVPSYAYRPDGAVADGG